MKQNMDTPFQRCLQTQIDVLERELTPRKLKSLSYPYNSDQSLRKLKEFPFGDDFVVTRKKHETDNGCTCTCGLPNKKYCMLTAVGRKGNESKQKVVWAPMSICKVL